MKKKYEKRRKKRRIKVERKKTRKKKERREENRRIERKEKCNPWQCVPVILWRMSLASLICVIIALLGARGNVFPVSPLLATSWPSRAILISLIQSIWLNIRWCFCVGVLCYYDNNDNNYENDDDDNSNNNSDDDIHDKNDNNDNKNDSDNNNNSSNCHLDNNNNDVEIIYDNGYGCNLFISILCITDDRRCFTEPLKINTIIIVVSRCNVQKIKCVYLKHR